MVWVQAGNGNDSPFFHLDWSHTRLLGHIGLLLSLMLCSAFCIDTCQELFEEPDVGPSLLIFLAQACLKSRSRTPTTALTRRRALFAELPCMFPCRSADLMLIADQASVGQECPEET